MRNITWVSKHRNQVSDLVYGRIKVFEHKESGRSPSMTIMLYPQAFEHLGWQILTHVFVGYDDNSFYIKAAENGDPGADAITRKHNTGRIAVTYDDDMPLAMGQEVNFGRDDILSDKMVVCFPIPRDKR